MVRIGLVLLIAAAGAGMAVAAGPVPITLRVGEVQSFEVGYAMGSFCDDPTIVRGEMQQRSFETNLFVVTGLKEGTIKSRLHRARVRLGRLLERHQARELTAVAEGDVRCDAKMLSSN